ncbi:MAG: hypothetical protein KJO52_06320, partial [Maribacter sp.]|nr:hypothetical protein [Maribacter sp.]
MKLTKTFILLLAILSFGCHSENSKDEAEKPIEFDLPENFVLEDLYQPSKNMQGSWVALAPGPDNDIYACDQYGKIYHFNIPAIGSDLKQADVRPLDLEIGEAHGLLWAFNSLYVAVNKNWNDEVPDEEENGSGIYRITDTDDDGELDMV